MGFEFSEASGGVILIIEDCFADARESGLMTTSPPLNVKAESLELNSISGLTTSELTTMGKSRYSSS
jgi:hypothetical protein